MSITTADSAPERNVQDLSAQDLRTLAEQSHAWPAVARITAEAILEAFDGRFYKIRVTARDDEQEIGRGTVGRAVVSVAKFLEKMKKAPGN